MNPRILVYEAICAAALLCAGAAVADKHADSKKGAAAKEAPASPDSKAKEMMAAMAKYSGPSEKHKVLQHFVGTWATASKAWMGPGKPVEATGTAEVKPIMDGRFVQEDFTGTFMGRPFVGHGVTGYDLTKDKYTNFWVDNMGSWFTVSEGTLDATGKVLTMTTQAFDPQTGKTHASRMVTRIESDKRHVFEIYDDVNGKEVKVMEIVYSKK